MEVEWDINLDLTEKQNHVDCNVPGCLTWDVAER